MALQFYREDGTAIPNEATADASQPDLGVALAPIRSAIDARKDAEYQQKSVNDFDHILAKGAELNLDMEAGLVKPESVDYYLNSPADIPRITAQARENDINAGIAALKGAVDETLAKPDPSKLFQVNEIKEFLKRRKEDKHDSYARDAFDVLADHTKTVEFSSAVHAALNKTMSAFDIVETDPLGLGLGAVQKKPKDEDVFKAMDKVFTDIRNDQRVVAIIQHNNADRIKKEGDTPELRKFLMEEYQKTYKDMYGGIEANPIIDPISFLFAGTEGAYRGLRFGAGVAKQVASELGYEIVATGAFTSAELAGHKPSVQMIEGILGTAGTTYLLSTARSGLPKALSLLKQNRVEEYEALRHAAFMGDPDLVKERIREAMLRAEKTLDLPTRLAPHEQASPLSIFSSVAKFVGDAQLQENFTTAIITAITSPQTAFGKAAANSIGAGDYTWAAPVLMNLQTTVAPFTTQANQLARANLLGKVMGNRVLLDALGLSTAAKTADGLTELTLVKGKFDYGTTALNWGDAGVRRSGAARLVSSGKGLFKDEEMARDLVERASFLQGQGGRINEFFRDVGEKLFRHSAETQEFINVLEHVKSKGISELKYVAGGIEIDGTHLPLSQKALDKLVTYNTLNEYLHHAMNQTALGQAKMKNIMMLDDKVLVQEVKRSEQDIRRMKLAPAEGEVRWRSVDPIEQADGSFKKQEWVLAGDDLKRVRKLVDTDVIIPKEKIYVRREVADPYRVFKISKNKQTGEVKADLIASRGTQTKGRKFVKNAMANEKNPDVKYISVRADQQGMAISAAPGTLNEMYKLNPLQLGRVKEALVQGGVDAKYVDDLAGFIAQNAYDRKSFLLAKNQKALPNVRYLPADEAWAKYVSTVSRWVPIAEHMDQLKMTFKQRYGKLLSDPDDIYSAFIDPKKLIVERGSLDAAREFMIEAGEVRHKLRQIQGAPTEDFLKYQSSIVAQTEKLKKHGATGEMLGRLGEWALVDVPLREAKKFGANLAFLLSVAQAPLQIIGPLVHMTAKYVTDPSNVLDNPAINAIRDFMRAQISGRVLSRLGMQVSDETKMLQKSLRDSGFMSAVHMQEITGNADVVSGLDKWAKQSLNALKAPFYAGVGTSQAMCWYAARKEVVNDIKRGGLRYGLTPKDVDNGYAFYTKVNELANDIVINMTSINQPHYSRKNFLGQMTQFTEYAFHELELMTYGKTLTPAQKLSLWGLSAGVFGINGVPFLLDTLTFGQMANNALLGGTWNADKWLRDYTKDVGNQLKENGIDKAQPKLYNFITGGLPKMLSKGELNIAHRMSMGGLLVPYFDGLSPGELAGPGITLAVKLGMGAYETIEDIYTVLTETENPKEELLAMSIPLSRQLAAGTPGVQALIRAGVGVATGEITDTKGKPMTATPATDGELLQMIFGLMPGRAVEEQQIRTTSMKWSQVMKKHVDKKAEQVAEMMATNPEVGQKMAVKFQQEIMQVSPKHGSQFAMRVFSSIKNRNLPLEIRNQLKAMEDFNFLQLEKED